MRTDSKKILGITLVFTGLAAVQPAICAEELDAASDEALARTQAMLHDPHLRNQAVSKSKKAQGAHNQIQALAGNPENTNEIYDLSADIMGMLVEKTKGDPAKIKELLEQARKDPKAFAESFTPEQQKKLQEIAGKIPSR